MGTMGICFCARPVIGEFDQWQITLPQAHVHGDG